jgi:hypothetical protein
VGACADSAFAAANAIAAMAIAKTRRMDSSSVATLSARGGRAVKSNAEIAGIAEKSSHRAQRARRSDLNTEKQGTENEQSYPLPTINTRAGASDCVRRMGREVRTKTSTIQSCGVCFHADLSSHPRAKRAAPPAAQSSEMARLRLISVSPLLRAFCSAIPAIPAIPALITSLASPGISRTAL